MGEIAEMMLDGTLCECCGSYIGDGGGDGIPRYCSPQCAKARGAVDDAVTDEDCIAYLNDLADDERDQAAHWLRIFMGIGKKRAKRIVAQWRSSLTPSSSRGGIDVGHSVDLPADDCRGLGDGVLRDHQKRIGRTSARIRDSSSLHHNRLLVEARVCVMKTYRLSNYLTERGWTAAALAVAVPLIFGIAVCKGIH